MRLNSGQNPEISSHAWKGGIDESETRLARRKTNGVDRGKHLAEQPFAS
jgi:hypothetical protein